MASDDKKTSPAPKNETAVKKDAAAKKDEGQPKNKTTSDADPSGNWIIEAVSPYLSEPKAGCTPNLRERRYEAFARSEHRRSPRTQSVQS